MSEIHPIFSFELAQAIDFEACKRLVGGGVQRLALRHRGRPTMLFQSRLAPLRLTQDAAPIALEEWRSDPLVDVVLYDFGAASVAYRIALEGGLEAMRRASSALRRSDAFRADARARAAALVSSLEPAFTRPRLAELSEDYTIFGLRAVPGAGEAGAWCQASAAEIAGVLRPDDVALSPQEIADATALSISFGPSDVTMVDWDAAFVLDPEPEDVRAVLDFANVQLLEMRWLDQELDLAIERSYQLLARRRVLPPLAGRVTRDLEQVATLQLESAVMLERVSNSLKVFGEEYLTRIYRLAARRFRLAELDGIITRKLSVIESIYSKMNDRSASLRLELLEWIVVTLIALELVLGLLRR
jgi:hypothetical protein